MPAIAPRVWNDTDIPAVPAADLAAALSLWLARERQGMVLVGAEPPATIATIEAAVIDMHDDPARGWSVLLRLRSLIGALAARRFRHLIRPENAANLSNLIAAASELRLNPTWGMSPLRLAWAMAASETAVERQAA